MTLDPDDGFGLLSPEDQEKMELILSERSATLADPNSARVICFLRLILWKDRW
jgi:hypothetical protein